eukprot:5170332-Amphidinium_carterae.2
MSMQTREIWLLGHGIRECSLRIAGEDYITARGCTSTEQQSGDGRVRPTIRWSNLLFKKECTKEEGRALYREACLRRAGSGLASEA